MAATNRTSMMSPLTTFEKYESNVRSYIRSFPAVFTTAKGSRLQDVYGRSYIDFFAGAGALNYGHNPDMLQSRLLRYIETNGITHSLD
ncbi:MAG: diaminobutyrate--2-oxoglutarate transaminase, partial [Alicyclobacillus herbarius]|nr:diaminobutyrate--2-oxoglutarate transaminase [Alicyclobacillus herbarius]